MEGREATRVAGSHNLAALRIHRPQVEMMAFCQGLQLLSSQAPGSRGLASLLSVGGHPCGARVGFRSSRVPHRCAGLCLRRQGEAGQYPAHPAAGAAQGRTGSAEPKREQLPGPFPHPAPAAPPPSSAASCWS